MERERGDIARTGNYLLWEVFCLRAMGKIRVSGKQTPKWVKLKLFSTTKKTLTKLCHRDDDFGSILIASVICGRGQPSETHLRAAWMCLH